MFNKIFGCKKGFTIIEMLVTIFFLSVGVTGVLVAIQQVAAYVDNSFYNLTAVYLAQEGIEIVRNIRDGNWLEGNSWDDGLAAGDWEADYAMSQGADLVSWSDPGRDLKIDGGFYKYSISPSATSTPFKRKITISKTNLDGVPGYDQMKVKVKVTWEAKGQHEILAEEYLYNWRE